jgi:hypothetical protein
VFSKAQENATHITGNHQMRRAEGVKRKSDSGKYGGWLAECAVGALHCRNAAVRLIGLPGITPLPLY